MYYCIVCIAYSATLTGWLYILAPAPEKPEADPFAAMFWMDEEATSEGPLGTP